MSEYPAPQGSIALPLAVIGLPNYTAYLPDFAAPPKQIRPQSSSSNSLHPAPMVCQSGNPLPDSPVTAVPAVALIELAAQFTSPFHVVASLQGAAASCCGDCNADGKVTIDELVAAVNFGLNDCPK